MVASIFTPKAVTCNNNNQQPQPQKNIYISWILQSLSLEKSKKIPINIINLFYKLLFTFMKKNTLLSYIAYLIHKYHYWHSKYLQGNLKPIVSKKTWNKFNFSFFLQLNPPAPQTMNLDQSSEEVPLSNPENSTLINH